MNNEKRDEFLSWRGRLDPMEGVPGQGLDDHEAAWERLMDRFRERPRRRLPVYGIVAACLLLALIPAARLFQDRSSHPTARSSHATPRPAVIQPVTPLALRPRVPDRVVSTSPSGTAPLRMIGSDEKRIAGQTEKPGTGKSKAPGSQTQRRHGDKREMAIAAVTVVFRHPSEAPPSGLLPSMPTAHQAPVVRREWKVVDLNELNAGWHPSSGTASNRRPGFIRIGLGSQEAGTTDEGAPPVRALGLKIKLSTSN